MSCSDVTAADDESARALNKKARAQFRLDGLSVDLMGAHTAYGVRPEPAVPAAGLGRVALPFKLNARGISIVQG